MVAVQPAPAWWPRTCRRRRRRVRDGPASGEAPARVDGASVRRCRRPLRRPRGRRLGDPAAGSKSGPWRRRRSRSRTSRQENSDSDRTLNQSHALAECSSGTGAEQRVHREFVCRGAPGAARCATERRRGGPLRGPHALNRSLCNVGGGIDGRERGHDRLRTCAPGARRRTGGCIARSSSRGTEFGVDGARATTYLESYHGLASKLGSKVVANCASCHGVHNILPSGDSRSTINRANLVKTCGQCHPDVNEKFALGKVHVDAPLSADTGSVAVRWIRKFYLGMIFMVIGAMLVHNLIIWRRKAIARRKSHLCTVIRMTQPQRWQHVLLFTSFFVLVFTGFALKFPD